jgi:hypothetical protein
MAVMERREAIRLDLIAWAPLPSSYAVRRPALIALRILDLAMPVALAALLIVCVYIRATQAVARMLSRNR